MSAYYSKATAKKLNKQYTQGRRRALESEGASVGNKYYQKKKVDSGIRKRAKKGQRAVDVRTRGYHKKAMSQGPNSVGASIDPKGRRTRKAADDPILKKLKAKKAMRKSGRGHSRW